MKRLLIAGTEAAGRSFHEQLLKLDFDLTYLPDPLRVVGLVREGRVDVLIIPPYPYCAQPELILRECGDHNCETSVLLFAASQCSDTQLSPAIRALAYQVLLPETPAEEIVAAVVRASERTSLLGNVDYLKQQATGLQLSLARARDIRQALYRPIGSRAAAGFAMEGFDIGVFERPAEGAGGDFNGWFVLPGNKLVVYLGDAAGHDLAATVIRDYVTHELDLMYARESWELLGDPARLLAHLNALMHPARQVHASMLYMVIDQSSHKVTYASAGHTPFVARTAQCDINLYFSNSVMLGMEAQPSYKTAQILLDHYTHLTLYSDGLLDARELVRREQRHGYDMEDLKYFQRFATEDPRPFAQMIFRHFLQISGVNRPQTDDISIMVIRTGISYNQQPFEEELPAIPSSSQQMADDLLGINRSIGAEAGYDAEKAAYYVAIHGKADYGIANALMPKIEQALQQGMRTLILDCFDMTALDSCFMGTLQELNILCRANDIRLHISIGKREFIDNLKELYLTEVVQQSSPERWEWHKQLRPICRERNLDSRRAAEHLFRTHELLAEQSPQNRQRFEQLLALLQAELRKFDD